MGEWELYYVKIDLIGEGRGAIPTGREKATLSFIIIRNFKRVIFKNTSFLFHSTA